MVITTLPRPARASNTGRPPVSISGSIPTYKPAGRLSPGSTIPRIATPATASHNSRRPGASADTYKRSAVPTPTGRREPPAPRPAQAGRAYVGTTIPPPRLTKAEVQNANSSMLPPTRVGLFEPAKTPSLVSSSSLSTMADSPGSNILKRKESLTKDEMLRSTQTAVKPAIEDSICDEDGYPNAVFGISVPPTFASAGVRTPDTDILNLDQYMMQQPITMPPPLSNTPLYALTATPSTRYSPGPFSVSSTPTTVSCYSPATNATAPRPSLNLDRQYSPAIEIPSSARKNTADGVTKSSLPARQNSSSSGSTVKASDDGNKLRSPIKMDSKVQSRLTRSKIRIGNDDKKPALLQKKPPSAPMRPPEFAHLADASPIKRVAHQRPERPSRENTPDMVFKNVSPVIQSNLTSLPTSTQRPQSPLRTDSTDTVSIGARGRFGIPRKAPSRQPSPALKLSIPTAGPRSSEEQATSKRSDSASTAQSSAGAEKSQSRFGLFRRGKSEPRLNTMSPEKRLRKAPMAGSGHEVYGKFGIRHRSGSSTSANTSAGRSSSTGSTRVALSQPGSRKSSVGSKRGSVTDDFVSQRLSPVTLRGAGAVVNSLDAASSSKTSSVAVTGSSLSIDGMSSSATDETPQTASAHIPTSETQAEDSKVEKRQPATSLPLPQHARNARPPHTGGTVGGLSSRRSMIEPSSSPVMENGSKTAFHFSTHPAVNPLARKMSEPAPQIEAFASLGSPQQHHAETQPTSSTPRLTRKWNFLWTNKSTPKVDVDIAPEAVAVSLPSYVPSRQVGHYALQDVPQKINVFEIERIMQEAENFDEASTRPAELTQDFASTPVRLGDSVLLPAPPIFDMDFPMPARPASPKVSLQPHTPFHQDLGSIEHQQIPDVQASAEALPNVRPSRLPQVGRIPRVVSKRDRERKPPVASFSRPFDASQPSPATNSPSITNGPFFNLASDTSNTIADLRATDVDSQVMSSSQILLGRNTLTASPETLDDTVSNVVYSPCNRSSTTSPSRRSSMARFIAPIVIPGAPVPTNVDDVWHEYDDLLDLLSTKTPKTPKTPHTGSSLGAPFHYAELGISPIDAPMSPVYPFSRKSFPSVPSMVKRLRYPSGRDSMTIRTSRSFTSAPTSPVSTFGAFDLALDRRASALAALTGRRSLPPASRSSGGFPRMSLPRSVPEVSDEDEAKPRTSHGGERKKRDSKRDSINVQTTEAQHMGFESMVNLRTSALATSKWLSFGRVLFSPAHDELQNTGDHRILVLDGLGKDWSFYLALSYQNAVVYNLGADPAEEPGSKKASLESPPNHRHLHHSGLSVALPFSNGFFSAIVFRFPAIASEATYKFALGECKRVLRPGGYLEVSVLDMDMLNMGNFGRRALRSLKTRIHDDDPSVSFKSITDTMQRLLGRRGFENLNRCVVGVPAAGSIPHAKVEESGEGNSAASAAKDFSRHHDMPSLGELMRTQSTSDIDDDGITRMVARVARWWYSRCYESLALAEGDMSKSIWSNKTMLEECEERGTSIRLMVCFAQKPECVIRRTISV